MNSRSSTTWNATRDVITRFADVIEAARDNTTFGSVDPQPDVFDRMTRMDPPRHDEWRGLTAPRFRPRTIAALEQRAREIASRACHPSVDETGVRRRHEIAGPIPSTVVGDLIGVPRELNARFHELSMISIAATYTPEAAVANEKMCEMFEPLIAARRREPGDDIISLLVQGTVSYESSGEPCHPRPLTQQELLGYCLHLVVAGNDTTTNLIGSGDLAAGDPSCAAHAAGSGAEPHPAAIEEMLRLTGRCRCCPRRMARDRSAARRHHPGGVALVELYWGAGEPRRAPVPQPDGFDIARPDQSTSASGTACTSAWVRIWLGSRHGSPSKNSWPPPRIIASSPGKTSRSNRDGPFAGLPRYSSSPELRPQA